MSWGWADLFVASLLLHLCLLQMLLYYWDHLFDSLLHVLDIFPVPSLLIYHLLQHEDTMRSMPVLSKGTLMLESG